MNKLKVLELFGGIGACSKALERLGIDYEIADYVEIDKYAVKSFNAMHGTNFEPQDICKWDKDIEVDLIMHGSPCQDFSLAGLQAGGDEGSGTRSSLMYETIRIVNKLKPKYVIWENVKNVVSKKHIHNFNNYIEKMSELNYTSYYQILNAKDYEIPQNRERLFTISIRNDLEIGYLFPPKKELKLKLKDMLEDEVDEKYYLSDKMISYISATGTANFKNPDSKINLDIARPLTTDQNKRAGTTNYLSDDLPDNYDLNEVNKVGHIPQWHQRGGIYDENGLAPTICATDYKTPKLTTIKIKNNVLNMDLHNQTTNENISQCLTEPHHNLKDVYDRSKAIFNKNITYTISTKQDRRIGDSNFVIDNYDNELSVKEYLKIKNNTKKGYLEAQAGDGVYTNTSTKRGTVQKEMIQTLTTFQDKGVVMNDLRIRKLTPKECWRLMGFDDEDFEKAEKVNSNTQLYKQAGNSIVVNVLEEILKELLC